MPLHAQRSSPSPKLQLPQSLGTVPEGGSCSAAGKASGMLRAQDKSWRVRYNVAQQLYQLSEALGPDLARCVAAQLEPVLCSGVG